MVNLCSFKCTKTHLKSDVTLMNTYIPTKNIAGRDLYEEFGKTSYR